MPLRRFIVVFGCAVLLAVGSMTSPVTSLALDGTPPAINEPVVATYVAGEISLTGVGLGAIGDDRVITITDERAATTILPSSSSVLLWEDGAVRLQLPPEVHSGSMVVTVNGASSAPLPLRVFEYTSSAVPATRGRIAYPLALAVGANGNVWINEEAHTEFKWLSAADPSTGQIIPIPQTSPPGIFAAARSNVRTPVSVFGEDIIVDTDGSIWLSEGGDYLYVGSDPNSSRVLHYTPSDGSIQCYVVPVDDAEITGLLIDHARDRVWYAGAGLGDGGNAIGAFSISEGISDCSWTPGLDLPADICGATIVPGCHLRFPLPQLFSSPMQLALDASGDIWFTEYWGNRIGRLHPETGQIDEYPLPAPIIRVGPGLYAGGGPWDIKIDERGDLWIAEEFDGTISRLRPSRAATNDCLHLNAAGTNPCIDEIYIATDGYDGISAHTVAIGNDGVVWFGLTDNVAHTARVGFIDTTYGDTVVLLPVMPDVQNISGVVQDRASGDVWFGQFSDRRIGRLRLASGDADGVADSVDNCPTLYNPRQENADGNFVDLPANRPYDDLTWPNSDEIGDVCDPDADNDGVPNDVESALPGPACPSASSATDPLRRDTDGDMVLDGAECRLGSDPANAASFPARAPANDADRDQLTDAFELSIGSNPNKADTDGDRVNDGVEFKNYNSDPLRKNTDGDRCDDGKEVSSVNSDYWVNAIDQLLVAVSTGSSTNPKYAQAFDINKDGAINAGDMGISVVSYGPCA